MADNKQKSAPADRTRRQLMLGAGAGLSAVALTACGGRESEPVADVRRWDFETDVIVAGSGSAGTSAAIEARRAGAEVLVLESLTKLGGSSAMSGGVVYCGGGTPLQKALGFEDSVEAMYNYIVEAGAKYPQLDKVQLYCERSVEHFQWLVDNGVPYNTSYSGAKGLPGTDDSLYYSGNELTWPYRDLAKPAPRGHVPGEKGWTGGRRLMEALIGSAQSLGVTYRTAVSCERLVQESDGRIAGLVATIDGKPTYIRARKGVVLACGGFIHNREMTQLYAPELHDCAVPWANKGDLGMGIQMGIGAGAAAARMHHGFAIIPLYQPEHVLKGMVVNREAQRIAPEESYHAFMGHEIAFNQGGQAWLITDADSQYGYKDYRLDEAARADTLDELGRKIGLPDGALQHSAEYYNRFAEKGEDPVFHKDPKYLAPLKKAPFVAYDLNTQKAFYSSHTFGGLHTNTRAEVLDAWGEPIAGLFAAGRTTWGLPSAPYIASGISVGDCTFFGRRAGEHVAKLG